MVLTTHHHGTIIARLGIQKDGHAFRVHVSVIPIVSVTACLSNTPRECCILLPIIPSIIFALRCARAARTTLLNSTCTQPARFRRFSSRSLVDPSPDFIAICSPIYGYDPVINQRTDGAVKMLCDSYEYNFLRVVLKKSHSERKGLALRS